MSDPSASSNVRRIASILHKYLQSQNTHATSGNALDKRETSSPKPDVSPPVGRRLVESPALSSEEKGAESFAVHRPLNQLTAVTTRVEEAEVHKWKDIRSKGKSPERVAKVEAEVRAEVLALESALQDQRTLRSEVQQFAHLMESTLRANESKGTWKGCDLLWLLERLEEEVSEVKRAITEHEVGLHIACEAADVANFAMMIADVSGGLETWTQGHK